MAVEYVAFVKRTCLITYVPVSRSYNDRCYIANFLIQLAAQSIEFYPTVFSVLESCTTLKCIVFFLSPWCSRICM